MNPDKIEALVREHQEKRAADARADIERKAKYLEAVSIENIITDKIVNLFDELGIERDGVVRSHEFDLGDSGSPRDKASTTVSIYYDQERQPGPTKRSWFGVEKPSDDIYVNTDDVKLILITTMLGNNPIESHAINPYDIGSRDSSENSMKSHFGYNRAGRVPYIKHEDPDQILEHVRNIAETVDMLVALNSTQTSGVQTS